MKRIASFLLAFILTVTAVNIFADNSHIASEWAKDELSKAEQIAEIIKNTLGAITKTEIKEQCSGIAEITVQRALADLVEKGDIIKIGGGRYTKYVWNSDRK